MADDLGEVEFPEVNVNRALLLVDLQNEFLSEKGELKVANAEKIISNISKIVPQFRDVGDVIWAKTERKKNNTVPESSDDILISLDQEPKDAHKLRARAKDSSPAGRRTLRTKKTQDMLAALMAKYEMPNLSPDGSPEPRSPITPNKPKNEEFLGKTAMDRGPDCCVAGLVMAAFADSIEVLIDRESDMVMSKQTYSAFKGTSLLPALRGGLITEIYVAGAITNIQVYATVLEATQYGFNIVLIEDCLGFNYQERHDEALKQMCEDMGSEMITSSELVSDLTHLEEASVLGSSSSLPGIEVDERFKPRKTPTPPTPPPPTATGKVPESSPADDSVAEVYQLLQQISLKDPGWANRAVPATMRGGSESVSSTMRKRDAERNAVRVRRPPRARGDKIANPELSPDQQRKAQGSKGSSSDSTPPEPPMAPEEDDVLGQKAMKPSLDARKIESPQQESTKIADASPALVDSSSSGQEKKLARKKGRRSLR